MRDRARIARAARTPVVPAMDTSTALLVLSLALAVAVPAFWGGGFGGPARSVFVALAGAALVVAATVDGASASAACRSPVVASLIALALLSVASAAWSVAGPTGPVRTGLVVGGYAAVVIASGSVARRLGSSAIATAVAGLAGVEGLLGLGGVALHALPDAERLGRTWRPGGTFEYQPALALLQVGALPVLVRSLRRPGWRCAGLAAASSILAGSVLALANSRLALALAALVLVVLGLRRGRESQVPAVAVALLATVGGLVAPMLLGAGVGPRAGPAGADGLVGLLAIVLLGAIAPGLVRLAWRRKSGARAATGLLCGAVALAGAVVVTCAYTPGDGKRPHAPTPLHNVGSSSTLLHGRAQEWLAAIETWRDRPLVGAGAGSYAVASFPHQRVARSLFAHDLPLELAAELGIAGLLLGLWLYAASGCAVWRAIRTDEGWLLAPFVVVFLFSNLVDWTWHLSGLTAMWAAAVGGLGSTVASERRTSRLRPLRTNNMPRWGRVLGGQRDLEVGAPR